MTDPSRMTWRQRLVCRILLIIATMVAGDEELRKQLHDLDCHIAVHGEERGEPK